MCQPSFPKRRGKRFAVSCELAYRTLETTSNQSVSGHGETVEISSNSVLFTTSSGLRPGCSVELSIVWPILRYESVPVTLTIVGVVVRADAGMAAIEVKRRQFRPDLMLALQARENSASEWVM